MLSLHTTPAAREADTSAPAEPIAAVLATLSGKLAQAGRAAADARAAIARGEPTAALEALLPTEQALRDALALHTAAVVLHLERP
jgi:hypothetical protein